MVQEIEQSGADVRAFLVQSARTLLATPAFTDTLSYHLLPDPASQARESVILGRLRQIGAVEKLR